tara:strand:- start:899 stop:1846 length:948 start_codon:yes stop_codon:yes gene_type:complete
MKKKILIAGGSGLLGTHLTKLLLKNKTSFISTYNSKIREDNLKKYYKKCNFLKLNECIKITKNIESVIICAASHHSGIKSLKSNNLYFQNINNINIKINLLEACKINKIKKIVWISSSTSYQESNKIISENQMNYNLPTYKIYRSTGLVYRFIEQIAYYYSEIFKMDINIIRTANIYGPYDNFSKNQGHVIPALIFKAMNKSKNLEVWGDPNVVRDFVYAEDLAKACYKVLKSKKRNLTLNFSSGKGVKIQKLAKEILKSLKIKKKILFQKSMPSSAKYRVLNNRIFNNYFRNFKRTKLRDGIKTTAQWLKKNFS